MSEDWEHIFSEPFEPPCQQTSLTVPDNIRTCDSRPSCCFDCLGEVDIHQIKLHENSYYKCEEPLYSLTVDCEDKYGTIALFDRTWDKGLALYRNLNLLFKLTSKEIMILENEASVGCSILSNNVAWHSNFDKNFKDSRFRSLDFLRFIETSIKLLGSDLNYLWALKELYPVIRNHWKALRKHVGSLDDLPDHVLAHSANVNGNKSTQASYHLIHLHLDIRWRHLVFLHILCHTKGLSKSCDENMYLTTDRLDEGMIIKEVQQVVLELFEISLKRFEKTDVSKIKNTSPFSCTCVQELWMLMIKMINTLQSSDTGKSFWDVVNLYLDMSNLEAPEDSKILKFFHLNSTGFATFSLWMLFNIARLHKYVLKDSPGNYSLLETNLRYIFCKEVREADVRAIMVFTEWLCTEVWEPKPETVLFLWEHFNKKMNSSFYVTGAPPSTLASVSKTPKGFINQLKSYLDDIYNVNDSFQHFLRIIGLHLKISHNIPRHWNLLKGRFYSKLTLPKFESLSNSGEYRFISLFLILGISQDINQIELKMVELIRQYLGKHKCLSEPLIKGQLGLVLLLLEKERDVSVALQPVSENIQSLSILENIDVFRLYVDTFKDILSLDIPLHLGQHLLIDKWISEYLCSSSENDVSRLLDTLVSLLNKLKMYCDFETQEQNIIMMIEKLWDQLKNYLASTTSKQETPYQVAEIAATLANISIKIRNKGRLLEIVNMFAFRNVTDISVLRQFVCTISQYEGINDMMPNFYVIVLKTWIKCYFLCSDIEHTEMKELTKAAIELPEMKNILGETSSNLAYSSDPFLDFISHLQERYVSGDIWQKQALRDKVFTYFEGLEKWVQPIVIHPQDFGSITSLYKTVGHMIRLISPLIYSKSKPNTLLQRMIDLLLLPMSVRNPSMKIHPHILAGVKASLHLFIEGLIYLDPDGDHYISRVLRELIMVYIPHCMESKSLESSSYSPFTLVNSFANYDNSSRQLILGLIINNFLKKKAKNPHPNASAALKFIKTLINTHKSNEDVLISLVKTVLERICDVLMYSENKSTVHILAKDILNLILNSDVLRANNKAGEVIMDTLSSLCHENLAWSSRQLFELLLSMVSIAPDLVRRFTPILLEQVKYVESKRGVGYDRTLRLGIERIEIHLRAIKEVT